VGEWRQVQVEELRDMSRSQTMRKLNPYLGADKSLARPTSRCVFLIVRIFRLMLVLLYIYIYIYIYSTNIPPIMIIIMIYETQNLLSL
jgi:hypothetical protein